MGHKLNCDMTEKGLNSTYRYIVQVDNSPLMLHSSIVHVKVIV